MGKINADNGEPHTLPTNKDFVVALLIDCINALFPNLNKVQIEGFVWKLFNSCNDWQEFKSTLRDLLISMKSFSSSNDEFYEEERKVSYYISYDLL
jgi:hypothetical protein